MAKTNQLTDVHSVTTDSLCRKHQVHNLNSVLTKSKCGLAQPQLAIVTNLCLQFLDVRAGI